jgi:hypothetical protein
LDVAADAVSWEVVCLAVKDVLDGVAGIGSIVDRPGGVPTWVVNALPLQAYWEIDVIGVTPGPAGVGKNAFETISVQIEGWMPYSFQNPNSSKTWRALTKRLMDQIRSYPTIANAAEGFTGEGHLPTVLQNNRVDFADTEKIPLCHHCVIRVFYRRYYTFTTSTSL